MRNVWAGCGLWMCGLTVAAAQSVVGTGLAASPEALNLPRWQARVNLVSQLRGLRSEFAPSETEGLKLSLLGDVNLGGPVLGKDALGGFRATSGVLLRPRMGTSSSGLRSSSADDTLGSGERHLPSVATGVSFGDSSALPYLGLGYGGASLRGGWSFSADLGLVARTPGNGLKFGKWVNGQQTFEEVLRDLHISPVLQVGVSYAF